MNTRRKDQRKKKLREQNVLRKRSRPRPHQLRQQQAEKALKSILERWEMWRLFRRLYSSERRHEVVARLLAGELARPRIELTDAARLSAGANEVVGEIERSLDRIAQASVPAVTPDEWWRWYLPVLAAIQKLVGGRANPRRDALFGQLCELQRHVWEDVLARRSRIDRGLYTLWPDLLLRRSLKIDYVPAEVRHFTVDGKRRPAYRSGVAQMLRPGTRADVWNDWPVNVLPGMMTGSAVCPVYVQGHALRRLEERMDLPEAETAFHLHLGTSLRSPVPHPGRRAGEHLVEYRMNGRRYGYLVAEVIDGYVLIRTFKFLTMEGTPEGNLIGRTHRLRREDLRYNHLDRWSTFAISDLARDPDLVDLFASCGCGHLFDGHAHTLDLEPAIKAADDLRDYLGMPPREPH